MTLNEEEKCYNNTLKYGEIGSQLNPVFIGSNKSKINLNSFSFYPNNLNNPIIIEDDG